MSNPYIWGTNDFGQVGLMDDEEEQNIERRILEELNAKLSAD